MKRITATSVPFSTATDRTGRNTRHSDSPTVPLGAADPSWMESLAVERLEMILEQVDEDSRLLGRVSK
jgi:hypothetical protein